MSKQYGPTDYLPRESETLATVPAAVLRFTGVETTQFKLKSIGDDKYVTDFKNMVVEGPFWSTVDAGLAAAEEHARQFAKGGLSSVGVDDVKNADAAVCIHNKWESRDEAIARFGAHPASVDFWLDWLKTADETEPFDLESVFS